MRNCYSIHLLGVRLVSFLTNIKAQKENIYSLGFRFFGPCRVTSIHTEAFWSFEIITKRTFPSPNPLFQKLTFSHLFNFSKSVTYRQRPNWSASGIWKGLPVLKSKSAPFLLAGSVREVFSGPADTNSVMTQLYVRIWKNKSKSFWGTI